MSVKCQLEEVTAEKYDYRNTPNERNSRRKIETEEGKKVIE